jgi:hypothetical protein
MNSVNKRRIAEESIPKRIVSILGLKEKQRLEQRQGPNIKQDRTITIAPNHTKLK